jgi:hypothetical protein
VEGEEDTEDFKLVRTKKESIVQEYERQLALNRKRQK